MLRRFVLAMVVMAITVTFAFSDTFQAKITKVDGDKVTYQKVKAFDKATKTRLGGLVEGLDLLIGHLVAVHLRDLRLEGIGEGESDGDGHDDHRENETTQHVGTPYADAKPW